MKLTTASVFAAMAARVFAAPALEERATPRIFLIGDSTMAPNGGGSGTQGWGEYLKYSVSISVINDAVAGRSARSYTDEGRFNTVAAAVASGDFVVIEYVIFYNTCPQLISIFTQFDIDEKERKMEC